MTVLHKLPRTADRHASKGRRRFGAGDQAVRYTEAWEHENFAEEQARWERSDPEYARICEHVRQEAERGGEASWLAYEAKARWDARTAAQRGAHDEAQRADHAFQAEQSAERRPATAQTSSRRRKRRSLRSTRTTQPVIRAREGHPEMHTIFALESNDSPAPGIMPEPVCVHDEPAVPTAARAERQDMRSHFRSPTARNSVGNEPTKLEVQ